MMKMMIWFLKNDETHFRKVFNNFQIILSYLKFRSFLTNEMSTYKVFNFVATVLVMSVRVKMAKIFSSLLLMNVLNFNYL